MDAASASKLGHERGGADAGVPGSRGESLSFRPYSSATCTARLSRCRSCRVSNAARSRGTMQRNVSPPAAPQQFIDRRDQRCRPQQDRRLRHAEHALQEIAGDDLLLGGAAGVGGQFGGQPLGLHPPHFGQHAQERPAQQRHRRDGRRPLHVRGKEIGIEIRPLHDRLGQRQQAVDHVLPFFRRRATPLRAGRSRRGRNTASEVPPAARRSMLR